MTHYIAPYTWAIHYITPRGRCLPRAGVYQGRCLNGADASLGQMSPGADVFLGRCIQGADVSKSQMSPWAVVPGADVPGAVVPGADVALPLILRFKKW